MKTLGHPMSVVREACALVESGWTAEAASRELAKRGISVTGATIRRWVDPDLAERHRASVKQRGRQARVDQAQFRLHSSTPEFKAAFIRRLDQEDVPKQSIAKVCTVLFGEPVSRHKVRRILKEVAA